MEKITTAKALKTIVLPNGKTVHTGDEFVYNYDFKNTGLFEIGGEQEGQKAPKPETDGQPLPLSVEEMKEIRLRAKDLKIGNWHTKGIDRLLDEIAEAEEKEDELKNIPDEINSEAKKSAENEAKNTPDEISTKNVTRPESGEEVVVSKMETVEEGEQNEGSNNA